MWLQSPRKWNISTTSSDQPPWFPQSNLLDWTSLNPVLMSCSERCTFCMLPIQLQSSSEMTTQKTAWERKRWQQQKRKEHFPPSSELDKPLSCCGPGPLKCHDSAQLNYLLNKTFIFVHWNMSQKHLSPVLRETKTWAQEERRHPNPHPASSAAHPSLCTEQARRSEGEAPGACCTPGSAQLPGSSTHTSHWWQLHRGKCKPSYGAFRTFSNRYCSYTLPQEVCWAKDAVQPGRTSATPRCSVARPGTCSVWTGTLGRTLHIN